ncbi:MAG: hypothetical protein JWP08_430 [Bryobacterales bacterium]|nr:hypothetical protein [Bryobacterales bacterium]
MESDTNGRAEQRLGRTPAIQPGARIGSYPQPGGITSGWQWLHGPVSRPDVQIPPSQVRTGMRGSKQRLEARPDGTIAMRFAMQYLRTEICEPSQPGAKPKRPRNRGMHHSRKAAGCKASSKSLRCRSAKPSPLPLPPVDGPKAGIRIAGQTPPGGLRVYLPKASARKISPE